MDGLWDHGSDRFFPGPVLAPYGTCVDPAFERFDLFSAEGFGQFGWGHDLVWVMAGDSGNQLTFAGLTGDDRFGLQGRVALIEPEIGFAFRRVRAMTGKTAVGKDGQDFATEAALLLLLLSFRRGRDGQTKDETDGDSDSGLRNRSVEHGFRVQRCRDDVMGWREGSLYKDTLNLGEGQSDSSRAFDLELNS